MSSLNLTSLHLPSLLNCFSYRQSWINVGTTARKTVCCVTLYGHSCLNDTPQHLSSVTMETVDWIEFFHDHSTADINSLMTAASLKLLLQLMHRSTYFLAWEIATALDSDMNQSASSGDNLRFRVCKKNLRMDATVCLLHAGPANNPQWNGVNF